MEHLVDWLLGPPVWVGTVWRAGVTLGAFAAGVVVRVWVERVRGRGARG